MKKILPVLVAVLLAACSSSKEPPLQGKRIDILPESQALQPDAGLEHVPLGIPGALDVENWPQAGGNSANVLQHVHLPEKVVKVWRRNIGRGVSDDSQLMNPPVVNSGKVFAIDTRSTVTAINLENGREVWDTSLPVEEKELRNMPGGVAADGDKVFATTGSGEVFALNSENGDVVWRYNVQSPVRAAPVVYNDQLYVVTYDNRLFSLSTENGNLLWTHSGIQEALSLMGTAFPAIAEGMVAVPYSSGEVYVLQAADGRYLWHDALSINVGADLLSSLVDVDAAPVIAANIMYAVNHNGMLTAFDMVSGQRLWGRELSATQMPWVAGNGIFIITDNGNLVCLNRSNGYIRWVTDLNDNLPKTDEKRMWNGPVLAGNRLIAASDDGFALSVGPYTGKVLSMVRLPEGVNTAPVVAEDKILFLTNDAEVVAFGAK